MSKALEAFGRITLHTEYDNDSHYDGLHFEDDCKLVDKALEFLEAIENANHSEALKCLECLYCEPEDYRGNDRAKDYEYVKQALLKAEKEHKALEIIKEKNVSVCGFRNRVFDYHSNMTINDTYEYYLNYFGCYHNGFDVELLTKEEFNLLKEVLE